MTYIVGALPSLKPPPEPGQSKATKTMTAFGEKTAEELAKLVAQGLANPDGSKKSTGPLTELEERCRQALNFISTFPGAPIDKITGKKLDENETAALKGLEAKRAGATTPPSGAKFPVESKMRKYIAKADALKAGVPTIAPLAPSDPLVVYQQPYADTVLPTSTPDPYVYVPEGMSLGMKVGLGALGVGLFGVVVYAATKR